MQDMLGSTEAAGLEAEVYITLVDSHNVFNKHYQLGMLCVVSHCWASREIFALNCCQHEGILISCRPKLA